MEVATKNLVLLPAVIDAMLAALSARPAGPLLAAPNVHLFQNPFTFSQVTLLTDLTESDFHGYAVPALGVLVGPVNVGVEGRGVYQAVNFLATSVFTGTQNAYGYFITDTTNAILYGGETFDSPIPFNLAGDFLALTVMIALPFNLPGV